MGARGTETFLVGTTHALRAVASRLGAIGGCGRCRLSASARAAGSEIEGLLAAPVAPGVSAEFVLDVALAAIAEARAAILAAQAAAIGGDFADPERVLLYRAAEILRRAGTARVVAGTDQAAEHARLLAAVYATAVRLGVTLHDDTHAVRWALTLATSTPAPTTAATQEEGHAP